MQAYSFGRGKVAPVHLLDKRITLQSPTITRDEAGGEILSWADVGTVWAYINPLSGHELANAQASFAEVTHMIIIRWQSAFSDPQAMAKMRIVYAGRRFAIGSAVDIDMAHQFLAISAQEGLSDG